VNASAATDILRNRDPVSGATHKMGAIAISANFVLALSTVAGTWGVIHATTTDWSIGSAMNIGFIVVGFICWAQLQWADSRRRAREANEKSKSEWNRKQVNELVEERVAWRMELRDALEKNERLCKDNERLHKDLHESRRGHNAAQLQLRELSDHIAQLETQLAERDRRHRGEH
jgi:hypothetical protein